MQQPIRTVRVGIIGLGTVGGGTVRLIQRQRDEYLRAYGVDLQIARGCSLDAERAAELGIEGSAFTDDWHDVTGDPAIDIVVELIGGEGAARAIIQDAIAHGKHVVSANKALLGRHMEELAAAAFAAGVQIRCEAACGGGIPIVNALEHALAGDEVLTVAGIVNGTTNYILSRMDTEGLDFGEVLADAQRLGYAEADPSADVDGLDAAAKLAILSSIAFHTRVTTDDVHIRGMRDVSAVDIEQARRLGMKIKLLAVARRTSYGIDAYVQPAMIPANHQLAAVNGAMNAVYVVGDAVGETMFYGAGAGAFPTATAVVGDILELARPLAQGGHIVPEMEPYERVLAIRSPEQLEARFYIRVDARNEADALSRMVCEFTQAGVAVLSVECVPGASTGHGTVVLLTDHTDQHKIDQARAKIEQGEGARVASVIRIEDIAAWNRGA